MNNTDRIGSGDRSRDPVETVGTVEHVACGLTGLFVAGVLVTAFYPALVAVTSALRMLSSTALVFVAVGLWFAVWAALELVWEWRAGRLGPG
jgi:hypothetical protein